MRPSEHLPKVALFAVIVLVVVGGVTLASGLRAPDTPEYGQSAPAQFQPENALATVSQETGEIEVADVGESKTVLIDRSHGNSFTQREIDPFVSTLIENGHTVEYAGSGSSLSSSSRQFNASLDRADAFVIINPTEGFSSSQLAGLETFVEGGGRVIMFADASVAQTGALARVQQAGQQTTGLLSRFGMTIGPGYLYNMQPDGRDTNFQNVYATTATEDSLTEGVDRIVLQKAAPVRTSQDATVIMSGAEGTHLSSTRKAGTYGVMARSGNLTVLGDASFLSPSSAYDAGNEVLIGNLIEFLVTGEKGDCLFPGQASGGIPVEPIGTDTPSGEAGATQGC